jgi:prolyl-tRNA synthetase
MARRDIGEKSSLPLGAVTTTVPELLDSIQVDLMERARIRLVANTVDTSSPAEALEAAKSGFARIPWRLLGEEGERMLNQDAVSVRCLQTSGGTLPDSTDPPEELMAVVGRGY